jgi:hypothetical protein
MKLGALMPHVFLITFISASTLVACEGCRPSRIPEAGDPGAPTVRLYVTSDLAGALEPCGCVKDQLGGLDHAAAFMAKERPKAEGALFVEAGPLFFMDPVLKSERAPQEKAKAETLARSLSTMGFVGFAPGRNDWAAGPELLDSLSKASGAKPLCANVAAASPTPWIGSTVKDVRGTKVGFIGVAAPDRAQVAPPEGVTVGSPTDAVKQEVSKVRGQGAKIVIVLAAVGRGEAKRIADAAPDVSAIVVGSPGGSGDANTETPPPERVGDVLIVETGNHLQTIGVLDFFVRDGSYRFADGSGLDRAQKRATLARQIDDLRGRIAMAEGPGRNPPQKDIDDMKARVAKLEEEKKALDVVPAPTTGSFFRYQNVEVRESMGSDESVSRELQAYYKRVNEMNRVAFADKKPRPVAEGESAYAGIDACVGCHAAAKAVWDKTPHAKAYATLSLQFKQFNLDCVSCHVTGYDQPGGSTVAYTERLENVQCEVCHGPSSKHVKNPQKNRVPIPTPTAPSCVACHHPPHVHEFDPVAKMNDILGPGHGRPLQ